VKNIVEDKMVNWKKKEKCKECNEVWRDFCGECNLPICEKHMTTVIEEDEQGVGWMIFCKECFDIYVKEFNKMTLKKIDENHWIETWGDN
jgi:hypothetical protein